MPPKTTQAVKEQVDYTKYSPRIFGLQMTDFHERINMDRMRKERLARARKLMKEKGISVMLVLLDEDLRYTLGYAWLEYSPGGAYALLPLEGEPILFSHGETYLHERLPGMIAWLKLENIRRVVQDVANSKAPFVCDAAWEHEANKFGNQIKETLAEMGLSKEVLYLDVHYNDIYEVLKKKGVKVAVNDQVLEEARAIKNRDEIECCRATAAICDTVHYELSKYAEPGKTERELAGYMNFMAMKYGAEPTPQCYVNSGQHTNHVYMYPTDKMLRVGDLMVADTIKVRFCGYGSCCYRTYSIAAKPTQKAIDTYKWQIDDIYKRLEKVKPGNTTGDVYPKESGMGRIHGLGIRNYGPPWGWGGFSGPAPCEFKEGMVFAIANHTAIEDEGQGVAFEEHVVVTKTGYEVLTHAPRELIIVPRR